MSRVSVALTTVANAARTGSSVSAMAPRYVPVGGGVGAPSVTWVLDDDVVGDNNLDWVTPVCWERGRLSVRRLSSTDAGEHAGVGS
jgi:hypothetical protein